MGTLRMHCNCVGPGGHRPGQQVRHVQQDVQQCDTDLPNFRLDRCGPRMGPANRQDVQAEIVWLFFCAWHGHPNSRTTVRPPRANRIKDLVVCLGYDHLFPDPTHNSVGVLALLLLLLQRRRVQAEEEYYQAGHRERDNSAERRRPTS